MPTSVSDSNHTIRRILVRGTTWLGDAVMTVPALGRLRAAFPGAHVTLLAPPRAAEVFAGSPLVDEVMFYRRREEGARAFLEAARELRRRGVDLALLFQNAFEAALLARLSGARYRVGYNTQGRGWLLTHKLPRTAAHRDRHQTYDYLDLVAEGERACFGSAVGASLDNVPALRASAEQSAAAEGLLRGRGLMPGGGPLVALNAGATNSRAKCWPADRFAALADRLTTELGAQVVLIGAPGERENAERVIAQTKSPRRPLNLAGETGVAELVGLLARCDLVVTNDTGPAHVAAALGTPTLTIFGPTNEFETAPLGPRSELIRAEGVECARCMRRDCPIDHRCMTRVSVDTVAEKSLSLIRQSLRHA
jgi:heptosyltransferase II